MKRFFLITLLTVLTATVGHAANDDIIVDGVVYEWYENSITHEYGYVATGWDEVTPIQSLHIRGKVDKYQVFGIANGAFEDNEDIVYLTIDEGITSIGQNAFCRCHNIEVAILPEGLETIEEEAFAFCEKLTTMVIPSTVTEIQAHAFSECTGVTDVYFLMTEEEQLYDFHWWDGVYTQPGEEEHGGMEFNTNQHTTIHIPEGMLQDYVDSKKFVAWIPLVEDNNCYPLWWIVNFGVVGREYTVSDELLGVYVDKKGGLYAKDDSYWLIPDKVYPGEIDYMKTTEFGNNYDQSNWVVLTNVDSPNTFKNHIIIGGTITGTLTNKKNPEIFISATPECDQTQNVDYVPNVYIPCSFMGRAQIGANDKTYAFVQPKPQELIHVEWAIYNDDDGCFYQPAPNGQANTQKLKGGFDVCYDLFKDEVEDRPELIPSYIYTFDAINRLITDEEANETKSKFGRLKDEVEPQYEPYTDGGVSDKFIVYPLYLTQDPLPTGVPDIVDDFAQRNKVWYSIDGRFVGTTKPTVPGLYIYGNRKVIVK